MMKPLLENSEIREAASIISGLAEDIEANASLLVALTAPGDHKVSMECLFDKSGSALEALQRILKLTGRISELAVKAMRSEEGRNIG